MQLNNYKLISENSIVEFELWGTWLDNEGSLDAKATKGNKIVQVHASLHEFGVILHDFAPKGERLTFRINTPWFSFHGDKQKRMVFETFCEIDTKYRRYHELESQSESYQHYCDVASKVLANS